MFLGIILGLIFFRLFQCYYASEVTIEDGTLLGSTLTSRNGREYFGFMSIPFAKPPVGDLRFEPPQPPERWDGVRDATEPPPMCIQKEAITYMSGTTDVMGQEDCLYLNVFTPKITKDRSFPVMVWIHGGGLVNGQSSLYDPIYFMDHDVVVVTIQYRLEVLGFLTTLDDVVPGNMGMKDQVMALKWVRKNIAAFGGDPNNVTLFGQSAGGACVHFHMISPLSVGLFHRAIAQSGSALESWAYLPREMARQRVVTYGVLIGCPTGNSREFIDCLKNIPAKELVNTHWKFYVWINEPTVTFRIVSEPKTVQGGFLYENPWDHVEVSKVPLITGVTSAEGVVRVARFLHDGAPELGYLNDHYKRILPISLFYGGWVESMARINQISESLKKFYFGDKDISVETSAELVDLYSDCFIVNGVLDFAKRRRNTTTFFYLYDYRNENSIGDMLGETEKDLGVSHGDELLSLFSFGGLIPEITEGDDLKVSQRMVNYWVNFASTGEPDPSNVWTSMKSDDIEYLHITKNNDVMKTGLFKERYQFWRSLNLDPPQ